MKFMVAWNYSGNVKHRVTPLKPLAYRTRTEAERKAKEASREDLDAWFFVYDEDVELVATFHEGKRVMVSLKGRDPRRVRKIARRDQGPYQVVQKERVVVKGLNRATALKAAQTLARRTKKPARVEMVTVVGKRKKTTPIAALGYDGKRLKTVNAFGERMRSRRDVSRADLKHLSGAALLKLLRQAMKAGDEEKAEMIGKELDRRGEGFRRGR